MERPIESYFRNAKNWPQELSRLRDVLHACGLQEDLKWGKPCYSFGGDNIAIIQPMKNVLALMFFKGVLLSDPNGLLEAPGPNSRSGRRLRFQSIDDINNAQSVIQTFTREAIEKAGVEIRKPDAVEFPDEFEARLLEDAELKAAFDALTPGRQRGYCLHIAGARQTETRIARIEKCRPRILAGKGMHDR